MAQQYQVDIVTRVQGASAVAKLEAALKKVEASSKAVDNQAEGVATSLQKLKNAASQSALANSKAALALEKLRLASLKASGTTDQAALAFQKLKVATAQSAVNSAKAAVGVNSLGNSAQVAGSKAKASAAGFKSMGAAINAAAAKITIIIGAVQTFSQVMGAAFERQNAEKRLQNLTGSTAEYEAALLSAAAVSQKFGITQTAATQALGDVYSRLSGVGYGLKEVTTIYEGFNAVARESGVSSDAASSAFLQLGQAMGSGVLQGDELRSILEQMPQLTQLIAAEMGIAAGEVKKFGSEGKITSEVIFAALQKASEGATDLNGKLTPAQQSMNDFNVAIDKASVALGTALIPALTGLIEAITPVISAVGTLVQKLDQLGASKVFEFLMAPARAFGELVNGAAGETENLSQAAKEAVSDFSSLPEAAAASQAPIEATAKSTEKIAQDVKVVNEEVQKTVAPAGKLKEAQAATAKLVAAQEKAQQKVTTETERTVAAQEKHSTMAQSGVQAVTMLAEGEGTAARYANQLAGNQERANAAISQGKAEAAGLAANLQAAASASAGITGGGGLGGGSTTSKTYRVADYYKMNDKGQIVETTPEERSRQKNQQQMQYMNAQMRMIQAHDASTRGTMAGPVGSMGFYNRMNDPGLKTMTARQAQTFKDQAQASLEHWINSMGQRYAEGGYVTGPQQAVVGEGGEPEYIIPASKMDSAMVRYSSGMRGSSVIPESANVSVNYNGSTVDMGGTSYINKGDVNGIVSQAVNQTLTTLAKSPRARLGAGLR